MNEEKLIKCELKNYLNSTINDYIVRVYKSDEVYSPITYELLDALIHARDICIKRNRF